MADDTTQSGYDASHIEVLEGLEAVRKRPGMYIGGTGSSGLHHLVWELIDNAVDEAAAGHANLIEVTLHRDGSVEVSDNGRGIPTGQKADGRTAVEVVFTELHAGGKFGSGAYGSSGGLHGVGASVVNALATKLVVEVDLDGATWRLAFVERRPGHIGPRGGFTPSSTLEKVKKIPARRTGTRVRFWPDTDIFDPDARIDHERVRDHVAEVCFLVPTLKVRLTDKRGTNPPEPEEFSAKGGLADFVDYLSIGDPLCEVITIRGEGTFTEKVPVDGKLTETERTCEVDLALRWVKGYDTRVVSFVNTIPTAEGGTHVAGFERALTKAVNDTLLPGLRKLAALEKKGKGRAEKGDVQEGLVAALKVTLPEPQFRGQTKGELGTPGVQSIAYEITKDGMVTWFDGGGAKSHISAVREKLAQAVINRVAARQTLDARRKAAKLGATGMPDKLADCRTHGMDAELLIVEGDSAAGPAKAGRNSENMAVLPLRGKVVNAGKATMKQVVENAEAQALFTAIGAGFGRDFNLDDARYGRIIILCDADVDGSHIRCLLLTLFYHYMRPLLEAGRVFAAQPPLYSVKVGDEVRYTFSDAERDALTTELASSGRNTEKLNWVRFKGLGEMDVNELFETCLDPENRILRRLTMEDAMEATRAADRFEVLMGSDVARRKAFLLENSELVDPAVLDV
ncbi:MAG: type IIA DNA topoisomerase subunit B [Candidatus Microthrix sp.]|jgi:DNA gyrase subunit B|uniref:DNA topoisomerase (ATP-hydrolyzing) n=1 Tax=Candidatus Neomicrothrix subdominans TaxID=2954438 RepID=A0A936NBJ3_9ACTN|nr:type IIA DNA topoisomerase subunit B [Candidatus Microthrix sp.]MBK6970307.1 type IIA DNA topoisomerase subunit B [Candidatus Microthrix sp.]MBK7163782.1 type IIA DNA topoisomerase subunit B [Candidatus Microthrix sp.]MBK9297272.1 type IIA DNA topoisomerase subunit B [Candidatus Microthrix subdominans]